MQGQDGGSDHLLPWRYSRGEARGTVLPEVPGEHVPGPPLDAMCATHLGLTAAGTQERADVRQRQNSIITAGVGGSPGRKAQLKITASQSRPESRSQMGVGWGH